MLGLYVSDHPLMGAEGMLRRRSDCALADLLERADGEIADRRRRRHRTAAEVDEEGRPDGGVHPRGSRRRDRGHGVPEGHARPRAQARRRRASSCVRGRVDAPRGRAEAHVPGRRPCSRRSTDGAPPVAHSCSARRSPASEMIDDLKRLLGEHPGESPVFLHLGESQVLRLPTQFSSTSERPRGRAPGAARARRHRRASTRPAVALPPPMGASGRRDGTMDAAPATIQGQADQWRSRSRRRTARR